MFQHAPNILSTLVAPLASVTGPTQTTCPELRATTAGHQDWVGLREHPSTQRRKRRPEIGRTSVTVRSTKWRSQRSKKDHQENCWTNCLRSTGGPSEPENRCGLFQLREDHVQNPHAQSALLSPSRRVDIVTGFCLLDEQDHVAFVVKVNQNKTNMAGLCHGDVIIEASPSTFGDSETPE